MQSLNTINDINKHYTFSNILVIDLKRVCSQTIIDTTNKLREYEIGDLDIKNKFHKKLFYHYYIYNLSQLVLSYGKYKCVFYLNCDVKYRDLLIRINSTIGKYFPFIFVYKNLPYKQYIKTISDGDKYELENIVTLHLQKFSKRNTPFYKIRYFCKKYDLNFLNNVYFADMYNVVNLLK